MANHRVILIAVDDDDLSEAAFSWALTHVLRPDDELHMLCVVLAGPVPGDDGAPKSDYFAQTDPQAEVRADREMLQRRYLSKLAAPGVHLTREPVLHIVKASLSTASVGKVICDHAAKLGASQVVMASHSKSSMAHVLLGSVAQHCAHFCPCPITVVRESTLAAAASKELQQQQADAAPAEGGGGGRNPLRKLATLFSGQRQSSGGGGAGGGEAAGGAQGSPAVYRSASQGAETV